MNLTKKITQKFLPNLRLIGVPEQVNIPIKICLERNIFIKYGLNIEYKTIKEGTGAMLKEINDNKADIAITVTDGFISGQASGCNVTLIGTYVNSPLIWSVCGAPNSSLNSISDFMLKSNKRIGISRLKSGSHTMSYYMNFLHNSLLGEELTEENFKVLGGFDNLLAGVQSHEVDLFLWELFTTKPWFDSGALKYLGEVRTPWSAFSIVSHPNFANDDTTASLYRERFVPALQEGIEIFLNENSEQMTAVDRIVQDFGHTHEDASTWLAATKYSRHMQVDLGLTERTIQILRQVGLVPQDYTVDKVWGGIDNKAIRFSPIQIPETKPAVVEEGTC